MDFYEIKKENAECFSATTFSFRQESKTKNAQKRNEIKKIQDVKR